MASSVSKQHRVRLEDASMKHLNDFHKLWSSEKVAFYGSRRVVDDYEDSKAAFTRYYLEPPKEKPWFMAKAIMVPSSSIKDGEEAAGFVFTARPSPWGLKVAYYLRDDCWGQGYASEGTKKFLEEYWSHCRYAPKKEIFRDYDEVGNLIETREAKEDEELVEINHLIAEVDFENVGSMRVAEKCGGELIDEFKCKLCYFQGLRKHAVWRIAKPASSHGERAKFEKQACLP